MSCVGKKLANGTIVQGIKGNYKVCGPCLELYYPYVEIDTKLLNSFQAKTLITRDRKRQLQEDIDQKLNYYYGVEG